MTVLPNLRNDLTATITSGQTKSAAVHALGGSIVAIETPAALTGTALSFEGSRDGSTYVPLYDETNTALSVTVGTSRGYAIPPYWFKGWTFIKVVSNAAEGADRSIVLVQDAV